MSGSRDGERTPLPNNGTSMRSLRPSRTTTGRATLLTSNLMEVQATSDVLLPTQDGGNCSDLMEHSLETSRTIKFWMYQEAKMLRIETSLFTKLMERSTNNGTSCMLTNGRVSLRKVK
jgi:hypothetical protein